MVAYSIFFLTGAAVVLPGTLLPLLARSWKIGDGKAGILFFCFSIGSSSGALLARGNLCRALSAGCMLVALGATLLATNLMMAVPGTIALYGCGLGLSMTSISLLRSRRAPHQRIAVFARLNLIWALGASCGPAILLHTAFRFSTTTVLHVTSAIFVGFAALVLLTVTDIRPVAQLEMPGARWFYSLRAAPMTLLCLISLTTGVEGGLSSWLASYMMRVGYLLGVTISATTAFGLGIVMSRLYHSRHRDAASSARFILHLHPVLAVAAIVVLIYSRSGLLSVACAFFAGAGVGPMYPLTLALQLNYKEAGNAGFLAGGIGASVVPMITGAVAGWTHSLRTGLCVPLVAAVVMLTLGARMRFPQRPAD